MLKVCIDSCNLDLEYSIINDNKVLEKNVFSNKNQIAEELIPLIKCAIEKNNLKFNQIDEIYLTKGPGSYTGERLGLTFAKIYALLNKNTKIYLISSLKVLSLNALDKKVLTLIDARNNACYGAIYQNGNLIVEEKRYEAKEIYGLYNSYHVDVVNYPVAQTNIKNNFGDLNLNGVLTIDNMVNNLSYFDLVKDPINIKAVYFKGKNGY